MPKLTARQVQTLTRPGFFGDGLGLYLQVAPSGSKSWVYRYQRNGRRRDLGLGGVTAVSLAEARERAADARRLLVRGIDPIEARRSERINAAVTTAKAISFKEAAERYIAAHRAGWRNAKHASQWTATLETYVYPHFGELPIEAVDVGLVLKALEPIWSAKPETASRVRGRIEAVLDWGASRGYRQGDNPARWRGHIENLLPKRSKVRRIEHHAALPYTEMSAFMAALREHDGIGARALEFAILTAARTGEVIGARWDEINLADRVWTIPGERMKTGKEHRVPLSRSALAILDQMAAIRLGDAVFPSLRTGQPLSNMALLMTLRRMGRSDLTAHGFRSSFRDWAAESTNFPAEVAEMALAHAVGDRVEAAYRRGDLFQKRRLLAEAWGRLSASPTSTGRVVPIRARAVIE
jgi:integrase